MRLARDFILYNLVAAGSAAADWIVFLTLEAAGVSHLVAQVGARLMGGVFSFGVNRRTFSARDGHPLIQGRRFLLLYAASLTLAVALLALLVNVLGVPVYRAKLLTDATCFLFNFAVMRGYVFRATRGITHRLLAAWADRRRAA